MPKGMFIKRVSGRLFRHSTTGPRVFLFSVSNDGGFQAPADRISTRKLPAGRGFAVVASYPLLSKQSALTEAAKSLPEAFRNATLYSDDRTYKLLRFPRSSTEFALELWAKSTSSASASTATPPFGCFMVDKDEVTLMVSNDVYKDFYENNSTHGARGERNSIDQKGSSEDEFRSSTVADNGIRYRLFTFDNVVLDPSLVGFMAVVTKALAENNISVLPYSAYSTDHIFVAEHDADRTRTILEGLSDSLSRNTRGD
jgi:hypothetical protein